MVIEVGDCCGNRYFIAFLFEESTSSKKSIMEAKIVPMTAYENVKRFYRQR